MKKKKTFTSTSNCGLNRLSDLVPQLISRYGIQQKGNNVEALHEAWRKVIGEPYRSITQVIDFKRGTIEIAVPHSAFVQELSFQQAELVAKIKEILSAEKIKKIKFVVRQIK